MAITNCGFVKKSDPIHDMNIGIRNKIDEFLDKNGNCLSSSCGTVKHDSTTNTIIIEITRGNLALKTLRRSELSSEHGYANIIIKSNQGNHFTILDELHSDEIYKRIRSFYQSFIAFNPETQKELTSHLPFSWESILEKITICKKNVVNLPEKPTEMEKKELCKKVMTGECEVLFSLKDDYSVPMGDYVKELGKRLFGIENFWNCL